MSLLIRGARLLTLDAADTEHACADIRIEDGVIQAIGPDLAADGAEIIDASGLLAMPGLVNGHFHSQRRNLRARQKEITDLVTATRAAAVRLEPYYAGMVRRSSATEVGFTRWGSATP